MELNDIITIIANFGFPILCCGAMAYYIKYTTDRNREQIDTMNEKHREEMLSVTEALNNNTLALQRLCERLGAGE